ncbi:hypothetical protein ACFE04_026535 [Oxalis oulophora]
MAMAFNKTTTHPTTLPKFSAILLFGDSSLDTGNNNYINPTLAKADKYPYGKDFIGNGPTGRFSNGKLVPDFAATFLGIKETVPPFLDPNLSDYDIRTGVCFASGGSGYDELTSHISNVIPMMKQLVMFKDYIVRLVEIVGEEEGMKIIANSFVVVSAGTNDFAIDFYDLLIRQVEFNIIEYQEFILGKLQAFVESLYDLGCRNLVVAGLPPIGCMPFQMTTKLHVPLAGTCLEDQNLDAKAYNNMLISLLPQMEAKLKGSRFLYADIYKPLIDMIQNPERYGFVETRRGCCGTGLIEVAELCNELSILCGNVSQFVFFDSIHPTEAACEYMAKSLEKDLLVQFYN